MIEGDVDSYKELAEDVENNDEIATVLMITLRKLEGADRLGVNVIQNIHEKLDAAGLGHVPKRLPNDQWSTCLLFKKGSLFSKIYGLIRSGIEVDTDEKLKLLLGDTQAQKTLTKVRALLSPGD